MPTTASQVHEFLASYPPAVIEIALSLRAVIERTMPEATETLDLAGRVIGYGIGAGYSGLVCTIIPSKKGAKLGIVDGAHLPDPNGLMEGSGKRHRHIQFNHREDVDRDGVEALLKSAKAIAATRLDA
jgi:hypothetical protein